MNNHYIAPQSLMDRQHVIYNRNKSMKFHFSWLFANKVDPSFQRVQNKRQCLFGNDYGDLHDHQTRSCCEDIIQIHIHWILFSL